MDIYDSTSNTFLTQQQLSNHFHSYQYFHRAQQIHPQNQEQLSKIISTSAKQLLVVTKITPQQNPKQKITQAISHLQLNTHLAPPQLEMIKTHPQSLFQNKLFNFKYAMEKQGVEVSRERQEQLRRQLMEGSSLWKQGSLEQLELVSKKYDKILQGVDQ